MSKILDLFRRLCDWYWVLVSLWIIFICATALLGSPSDFIRQLFNLLGLIGGIFWFFSGNRPRPS